MSLIWIDELLRDPSLLEPPAVVVPRFAWVGRLTLLAAPEKAGKSTIMGQAAAAVATASDFLGEPTLPGRVLWLDLDEPRSDLVRRLSQMGVTTGVALEDDMLSPGGLKDAILDADASLLVIDTLTEWAGPNVPDFRDASAWQPVLKSLREIAEATRCGVVILHHTVRDGSRYADSRQIGAGVDVIVEMSEDHEDPSVRRFRVKGRGVGRFTFRLRYQADGRYYPDSGELPLSTRVLGVVASKPGISLKGVRDAVGGRGKDVDAALEQLVYDGLVVDRGTGDRHAYHSALAPCPEPLVRHPSGQGSGQGRPETENHMRDKAGQGTDNLGTSPPCPTPIWGGGQGWGVGDSGAAA